VATNRAKKIAAPHCTFISRLSAVLVVSWLYDFMDKRRESIFVFGFMDLIFKRAGNL